MLLQTDCQDRMFDQFFSGKIRVSLIRREFNPVSQRFFVLIHGIQTFQIGLQVLQDLYIYFISVFTDDFL